MATTIEQRVMTAAAFRRQWREVGKIRRAVAGLDDADLVVVQMAAVRGRGERVVSVRPMTAADCAEIRPWQ